MNNDENGFDFLVGMGFSAELSQAALAQNETLEAAVGWALENQGLDLSSTIQSSPSRPSEDLKMVLVIREDLSMSAGKVAAQCVHAALGAYRSGIRSNPVIVSTWEWRGEKTVCLRCKSEEEFQRLLLAAQHAGLITHVVSDAGRTEVESGSKTVLAIGPAETSHIDSVTGTLRLY